MAAARMAFATCSASRSRITSGHATRAGRIANGAAPHEAETKLNPHQQSEAHLVLQRVIQRSSLGEVRRRLCFLSLDRPQPRLQLRDLCPRLASLLRSAATAAGGIGDPEAAGQELQVGCRGTRGWRRAWLRGRCMCRCMRCACCQGSSRGPHLLRGGKLHAGAPQVLPLAHKLQGRGGQPAGLGEDTAGPARAKTGQHGVHPLHPVLIGQRAAAARPALLPAACQLDGHAGVAEHRSSRRALPAPPSPPPSSAGGARAWLACRHPPPPGRPGRRPCRQGSGAAATVRRAAAGLS